MSPPSPAELKMRAVGKRVYTALQQPGGATMADLCKAAWPDGRPRSHSAMFVMLKRLDRRLASHGFAIARIGIGFIDHTYRLVVM